MIEFFFVALMWLMLAGLVAALFLGILHWYLYLQREYGRKQ